MGSNRNKRARVELERRVASGLLAGEYWADLYPFRSRLRRFVFAQLPLVYEAMVAAGCSDIMLHRCTDGRQIHLTPGGYVAGVAHVGGATYSMGYVVGSSGKRRIGLTSGFDIADEVAEDVKSARRFLELMVRTEELLNELREKADASMEDALRAPDAS